MRKRIILIIMTVIIIVAGLSGCVQQKSNMLKVQNGVLDISENYGSLDNKPIVLKGDWAFYWDKFLLGSELDNTEPDLYGQVPKAWNHYTLNGENLPAAGYATYRLHVMSDVPEGTVLGLQIPYFASAYRLYINEKEIAQNGIAATDKQSEVGQFSPKAVYFSVPDQNFDIVIQVSNFECAYGGFWNTMSLGTAESIRHMDELSFAKIFLTYGIVLIIAVYSLILFITNRELKRFLYFALMCLFSVLTIDSVDYQILFQGIMKISFHLFVYLWFSSSLWCVFFLLVVCYKIYPSKLSDILVKIYLAVCLIFQIIFTVTDTLFCTGTSDVHNAVAVFGLLFATIIAISGIIKGHSEGWINILCIVILLAVYVHDTLFLCDVIYNPLGKMCYFGILMCILLLMLMLLRLNKSYHERLEASELAFLQAQIKPHFIFNSLNTLIALSYEDIDKTRKLMGKFSQYLRNSFDFAGTNQFVNFDEEMEYVQAFAEIEKARFEERLVINFEIDDGIDAKVPILVLQPVIENAVVHGVLPRMEGGCISVSIKKSANQLDFCVKDDGVGFDTEQWEMTKLTETKKGIGLYNIDQRLKKLTKRGLKIKSEIGIGTQVSWSIPVGKRRTRYI